MSAVDAVEAELRELVRRRGLDPITDRSAMRRCRHPRRRLGRIHRRPDQPRADLLRHVLRITNTAQHPVGDAEGLATQHDQDLVRHHTAV